MRVNTLELIKELVSRPSVSPHDAGCQQYIEQILQPFGIQTKTLHCEGADNLWIKFGEGDVRLAFAGHTDVVPPGPESKWQSPPYILTEQDGYFYGRGIADMKGAVACMLGAIMDYITQYELRNGAIALLITSAEEGPSHLGTPKLLELLSSEGEKIEACLVGEPTSGAYLGDCIKVGRRGSLSCEIMIHGTQGHVAYPDKAENAIHLSSKLLKHLSTLTLDRGNEHFLPSSLQVTSIQSGVGAYNVIPGDLELKFNVRYSPEVSADKIKKLLSELLESLGLKYTLNWHHFAKPFYNKESKLLPQLTKTIADVLEVEADASTSGGTSDARYFSELGIDVVEFGLCNDTIHKVNERTKIEDIEKLERVYFELIKRMLL